RFFVLAEDGIRDFHVTGVQTCALPILVVAPLAAVDTWVMQVEQFASPQVSYWAEALGGTIRQRAEALADRGGQPFRETGGPARQIRRATCREESYIRVEGSNLTIICSK